MITQYAEEGGVERRGERKCTKKWEETEPLDVLSKIPMGCKPTERDSQEVPDNRERQVWSIRQLSALEGLGLYGTGGNVQLQNKKAPRNLSNLRNIIRVKLPLVCVKSKKIKTTIVVFHT